MDNADVRRELAITLESMWLPRQRIWVPGTDLDLMADALLPTVLRLMDNAAHEAQAAAS